MEVDLGSNEGCSAKGKKRYPLQYPLIFIVTVIDVQCKWKYLPGYFRDGVEKSRISLSGCS
jgi:hypothetical protein